MSAEIIPFRHFNPPLLVIGASKTVTVTRCAAANVFEHFIPRLAEKFVGADERAIGEFAAASVSLTMASEKLEEKMAYKDKEEIVKVLNGLLGRLNVRNPAVFCFAAIDAAALKKALPESADEIMRGLREMNDEKDGGR